MPASALAETTQVIEICSTLAGDELTFSALRECENVTCKRKKMNVQYKRLAILSVLSIAFTAVSFYISYQIQIPNMNYYHGKDNGIIVLFESNVVFGALLYLLLSRQMRIINLIIGLVVSIILSLLIYMIGIYGIWFALLTGTLIVLSFFVMEKIQKKKT